MAIVPLTHVKSMFYFMSGHSNVILDPHPPQKCHVMSIWAFYSTFHFFSSSFFFSFCNKLIESVRMMACVVRLSPLGAVQRMAWETASTFIVKLEVETCTGIMDGGRTLLDSEAPPRQVFGD